MTSSINQKSMEISKYNEYDGSDDITSLRHTHPMLKRIRPIVTYVVLCSSTVCLYRTTWWLDVFAAMLLKSHSSLMTSLWQPGPAADDARTSAVLGPATSWSHRRQLSSSVLSHRRPVPPGSSASRHTLPGELIHLDWFHVDAKQVIRLFRHDDLLLLHPGIIEKDEYRYR